ncbi:MAG: protein kinase [Myxococcales bacterium]|nr:protein kinase [Myxococcales bacterium]
MALLAGRYEVVRPIAQGGMATVYLAKILGEGGFERLVAVKVMHPHIANESEFVSMFLDEARLAARIRHPNVVPTLAVERNADGLFLVMEYIEGHPLHAILRAALTAKRYLSIPVALRIVVDLLEGLHAAHELEDESGHHLDLVHRDVSPQNVLVGSDGVSRITDFGVAHARARLATTQGSGLKGKVAYLSPEQLLTVAKVDRRSDVFAAGIVLWESLTGRRLFRGETEGQTIAQIMGGAKRAPHQVRPDIPELISQACMKALASEPENRFQTAVELADALEAAANEVGITLAKPREVAAEITALEVPDQKIDATKVRLGPGSAESSSGISPPAAAGTGLSQGSTTAAGSALSTVPGEPPRNRGRWLAVGVVGALLIGGGSLAIAMRSAVSATSPTSRPETAATGSLAAREEPPKEQPKPEVTALPSAEPEEQPAPSASAAPSANAASAPTPAPVPKTGPKPVAKPAGAVRSGPGYRPEGL